MNNQQTLKQARLSAGTLRDLVIYTPDTGVITRRNTLPRLRKGAVLGCIKPSGYVVISLGGVQFRAHRLAWLYMTGEWPREEIDHINGDKSDNRFANLREATHSQNNLNRKVRKDSRTGVKNVIQCPHGALYVRFSVGGMRHEFGPFYSLELAADLAERKRRDLHGEFALRHANPSSSSEQVAVVG